MDKKAFFICIKVKKHYCNCRKKNVGSVNTKEEEKYINKNAISFIAKKVYFFNALVMFFCNIGFFIAISFG